MTELNITNFTGGYIEFNYNFNGVIIYKSVKYTVVTEFELIFLLNKLKDIILNNPNYVIMKYKKLYDVLNQELLNKRKQKILKLKKNINGI